MLGSALIPPHHNKHLEMTTFDRRKELCNTEYMTHMPCSTVTDSKKQNQNTQMRHHQLQAKARARSSGENTERKTQRQTDLPLLRVRTTQKP